MPARHGKLDKEQQEFVVLLTKELALLPGTEKVENAAEVADVAHELMRRSREHHRHAEDCCNRELTRREEITHEKNEKAITELCAKYHIVPIFSNDPRACTVKLKVPSGATNDWGREGICVPQTPLIIKDRDAHMRHTR